LRKETLQRERGKKIKGGYESIGIALFKKNFTGGERGDHSQKKKGAFRDVRYYWGPA